MSPWKLAGADPEVAHIGISYAMRPQSTGERRFVTCCSQIFDEAGAGVEFIAYEAHDFELRRDNPFLSRNEMFRVMTRSMDLYRQRHAGRTPKRVMVHKTTEFKKDEVAGCMEALHLCEVDLVQISENIGWRGVKYDQDPRTSKVGPARFPIDRGTLAVLRPPGCAVVDARRCERNIEPKVIFQGGYQHATAIAVDSPCRARSLGRICSGDPRSDQNELE